MPNDRQEVPRGLPLVDLLEPATIRLISTAYIDEPAMRPLADDDAALAFLETIEKATSIRQNEEMPLPAGVSKEELLTEAHGYGWSYVNAAFCYTRAEGNRFNDASRGAWYAALMQRPAETAIAEVGYHLTRELANVGVYENLTCYREMIAGFIGPFVDLRPEDDAREPSIFDITDPSKIPIPSRHDELVAQSLDPDTRIGHPAGQRLARELRDAGFGGVVYPSLRREGGTCLAAFRTTMVQNIRQGATWELRWNGSTEFQVTEI